MRLTRRAALASAAAALATPAIAQKTDVLKITPGASLTALDPIWTPAGVTTGHAYHVFDTLYAVTRALEVRPQMAEGHTVSDDGKTWTIRLREGLWFHDGEPVRARDALASIARWSKRDAFGQLLAKATESMSAPDDRTLVIKLTRPFPRLADALAHPVANACFVMPERLAKTDAMAQVTEMVGSGPYRFLKDEFVSGSRVAYAKFDKYVPRADAADYAAGGKRAYFNRIEWHIIPDVSTAAAALQSGEIDWLEVCAADLAPTLMKNPQTTVVTSDPFYAALRFNSLQPPFNNAKLRHAVLTAIDQTDYMSSISGGDDANWSHCYAMFGCGQPHVRELGTALMAPPKDLAKAKALVAASGYNGEKVVILNPTDLATMAPHGELTADLLRKLGMNVDLQTMDWGTAGARRVSREPVEKNGWSIFHINTPRIAASSPALNFFIRGQGPTGFFGWFASPEIEALTEAWLAAPDADQDKLYDQIQQVAFEQAPIVPLGQFDMKTAYRRDLSGLIPASVLYPWNVRRG